MNLSAGGNEGKTRDVLSLPLGPHLRVEQATDVIAAVRAFAAAKVTS